MAIFLQHVFFIRNVVTKRYKMHIYICGCIYVHGNIKINDDLSQWYNNCCTVIKVTVSSKTLVFTNNFLTKNLIFILLYIFISFE